MANRSGALTRHALLDAVKNMMLYGLGQGGSLLTAEMGVLRNEYEELLYRYNRLQMLVNTMGASSYSVLVDGDITEPESETTEPIPPSNTNRLAVVNTLTWDELLPRAYEIAHEDYNAHLEELRILTFARKQPGAIAAKSTLENSLGISARQFNIHKILFNYYSALRIALDNIININYGLLSNIPSGTSCEDEVGFHVSAQPNPWFTNLMDMYKNAEVNRDHVVPEVGSYPNFVNLEDKVFKTSTNLTFLSSDGGRMKDGVGNLTKDNESLCTYSLDLPFQMATFANMFGTIVFAPDRNYINIFNTDIVYTDIQLLVHFTAAKSTVIEYEHFIRNEKSYFPGGEMFPLLVNEVTKVAEELRRGSRNTFFTRGQYGAKLVRRSVGVNGGELEDLPIPDNILSVFRLFIVGSMDDHLRAAAMKGIAERYNKALYKTSGDKKVDKYRDTPFGRLFNFSVGGVRDFGKLVNKIRGSSMSQGSTININLALSTDLGKLPIIQRVYTHIMVACTGIAACRSTRETISNAHDILVTSMALVDAGMEKEDDITAYNSVFYSLPGLLFHVIMGGFTEGARLNYDARVPAGEDGGGKSLYFYQHKYRVTFLNLFGSYLSLLPTFTASKTSVKVPSIGGVLSLLSDNARGIGSVIGNTERSLLEGLRWVKPVDLLQLQANGFLSISEVLCSFLNITSSAFTTAHYKALWADFTRIQELPHKPILDAKGGFKTSATARDQTNREHRLFFWHQPLTYTYNVQFIDVTKKPKKKVTTGREYMLTSLLETFTNERADASDTAASVLRIAVPDISGSNNN